MEKTENFRCHSQALWYQQRNGAKRSNNSHHDGDWGRLQHVQRDAKLTDTTEKWTLPLADNFVSATSPKGGIFINSAEAEQGLLWYPCDEVLVLGTWRTFSGHRGKGRIWNKGDCKVWGEQLGDALSSGTSKLIPQHSVLGYLATFVTRARKKRKKKRKCCFPVFHYKKNKNTDYLMMYDIVQPKIQLLL